MVISRGWTRLGLVAAAAALMLSLGMMFATSANAQTPPAVFYGKGLVAGQVVEAFIGGKSCGTSTVNAAGEWAAPPMMISQGRMNQRVRGRGSRASPSTRGRLWNPFLLRSVKSGRGSRQWGRALKPLRVGLVDLGEEPLQPHTGIDDEGAHRSRSSRRASALSPKERPEHARRWRKSFA